MPAALGADFLKDKKPVACSFCGRYSVYLLYWYKSANSDSVHTQAVHSRAASGGVQAVCALLYKALRELVRCCGIPPRRLSHTFRCLLPCALCLVPCVCVCVCVLAKYNIFNRTLADTVEDMSSWSVVFIDFVHWRIEQRNRIIVFIDR